MSAESFSNVARLIAFYLPQYHPIPENDEWWGKGFTEWRNVVRARPEFRGHYQPHLPGELGYYDLRVPETREAQAELARTYGIYGFCYYHYWFNGRRLLETPFNAVLESGEPKFPFCLCWANESWTRAWDGGTNHYLIQQQYSPEDDLNHIRWLVRAFADPRYIRVENKPLFLMYRAHELPNPKRTTEIWRTEAAQQGIGELFLACVESNFPAEHADPRAIGFDAAVEFQPDVFLLGSPQRRGKWWKRLTRWGLSPEAYQRQHVWAYGDVVNKMLAKPAATYPRYPGITPMWDSSARRKREAHILAGSTPELYGRWLRVLLERLQAQPPEQRILFVNAWNEWAEGNHLEPDRKHGLAYLEATRQVLREFQ